MPKKNFLNNLVGSSWTRNDEKRRDTERSSSHGSGGSNSKWQEKSCPGAEGYCGNTIKYNTEWNNIPTHCPSCIQKLKKANRPFREPSTPRQRDSGWLDKPCPGAPGHTCGNPILYRANWTNIPKYCEECSNREFEKKCLIKGCDHTIRYKLHYRDVADFCRRCEREMARGKNPEQCERCNNLMFVPNGKKFKVCLDCHTEEQVEKHEALRQSVRGSRLSLYASSTDYIAQALMGYANSSDDVNLVLLDGAARQEWRMPPMKRGERVDGGFDRGDLPYNFPTIDAWDERTGEVISVKSIDLGAQSYRNLNAIDRQIARYVCELANYDGNEGTRWQPEIKAGETKKRTLILVAPLITARDYQLNYLYSVNDAFAGREDICKDRDRKPIKVNVRVVVYIVD